jgi:hypothetical protein
VSFFELVVRDHSKDHLVAVAYVYSDTLTRTHTPLVEARDVVDEEVTV